MSSIVSSVDEIGDVFYARREGTRSTYSDETPNDDYLIVSYDDSGEIVGVKLMAASEMPSDFWQSHPDRGVLPPDLLAAIDEWMQRRTDRLPRGQS